MTWLALAISCIVVVYVAVFADINQRFIAFFVCLFFSVSAKALIFCFVYFSSHVSRTGGHPCFTLFPGTGGVQVACLAKSVLPTYIF